MKTQNALSSTIRASLADRTLSQTEAASIARQARQGGVSSSERQQVQRLVDTYADRFRSGAYAKLGDLARGNGVDTLRSRFAKAKANGSISEQEVQGLLQGVKKDGVTAAERRELTRLSGEASDHFTPAARALEERFRTTPDARTPNPFNQKLPTGPGQYGNRAINPRTHTPQFPIAQGTRMVDGNGVDRGAVAAKSVMLNYGQRKTIHGQSYVYAFSTRVKTASGAQIASGWIPEKALGKDAPRWMPTIQAPKPPGQDLPGSYTVTGGDASKYGDLKVAPNIPVTERLAAGDYLLRPGGVVNLTYSLPGSGGVSTDTFNKGVRFHRSADVKPVSVPLYAPSSDKPLPGRGFTFVYGHVGDRYGWIAEAALEKH